MEDSDDPYEVLGVSRDANAQQIRSAYRKAALRHHPDKQQTAEDRQRATTLFAKISNAYEILSDENQKRQYDLQQQQQQQESFGNFHDFFHRPFHDPFEVFNAVFREEFGAPSTSFRRSAFGSRDPFDDFMGGGMMMDPFGSMRGRGGGGGGFFGGSDPFADMFSSVRQMQEQMNQEMPRGGQNGIINNNNSQSYYYSSSSSSGGNGQESVTTQTTTRMVNGRQQTVTERIIRRADGTVERQVLEQSGDDDFPQPAAIEDTAAPADGHRRFLPFGNRQNSRGEQPRLSNHKSGKRKHQGKSPEN